MLAAEVLSRTSTAVLMAVLSIVVYTLGLAVYRIYLHPLRKFPGPKLAAASFWYEFYYDVVRGGQYTFEIIRMHEIYGMPQPAQADLTSTLLEQWLNATFALIRLTWEYVRCVKFLTADERPCLSTYRSHNPNQSRRAPLQRSGIY